MERILKGIQPEKCFYYFEEISRIPRSSYQEEAVSNYLVEFAKARGFKVIQDEAWNVLISKPATPGYEARKPVMLQGHMDMVCVKDDGIAHDFEKDPIPMYIDGDYIRAHGTTLGADNGTALCLMLALLDADHIEHPAIQCIFTSAEEVGLVGAAKLDPNNLEGEYLLNLDGGHMDQLLLSSAGGSVHIFTIPHECHTVAGAHSKTGLTIRIGGLTSGHSGSLSYRCYGNANKLMGNILSGLREQFSFELCCLSGGIKMNAIAKEAKAVIAVEETVLPSVQSALNEIRAGILKEYAITDPKLHMTWLEQPVPETAYSEEVAEKLLGLLDLLQDGPFTFMEPEKNMAKTSNNIGSVEEQNETTVITCLMRSNSDYEHGELIRKTKRLSQMLGIKHEIKERTSAWEFLPGSRLVELISGLYEQHFGEKPKITMTHGGVEPGVIIDLGKRVGKSIQAVNFGVTSHGAHTTKEELYIPSMEITFKWLQTILKSLD